MGSLKSLHYKRQLRNRNALKKKSNGRLRLSVFRSSRHIYTQIIDDVRGVTIVAASSLETAVKKEFKNCGTKEVATVIGQLIAEKALKKGVKKVVFDRGGYIYHGRIKNLADAARDGGLIF